MQARLIPSYDLDRVASTRTVAAGEPLRALAERLRTALDMISFTYMRSEADRVLRTLQLSLSCSLP